jgi:ribulose-5-phosphate 4-epimerase/fuculose-1-phosphate aldolase
MSVEEGIKFVCDWRQSSLPPSPLVNELIAVRNQLYQQSLVGEYESGIGYGNVSIRIPNTLQFFITASATGGMKEIKASEISLVLQTDINANRVSACGERPPSSESMTHAACYSCDPSVAAVVHVHNRELWEHTLAELPSTPSDIPYGTPEMATAIQQTFRKQQSKVPCVIGMAGHEEGVVAIGLSLQDAMEMLTRVRELVSVVER